MDKISKNNLLKISLPLFLVIIALISLSLINSGVSKRQTLQQKATGSLISPKKGVGGGATINILTQIKASWFFNWNYTPGYSGTSGLNNWDPAVWEKFVPLFYGKTLKVDGTMDLPRLTNSTVSKMNEICSNTSYCNKGSYYLIGNEPDINDEDKIPNTTNAPRDAVIFQGTVIKAIKSIDPTAKFIVLGLSETNITFVNSFLTQWKNYWTTDTQIASFPDVVSGWQFHTYNNNLNECISSDAGLRNFITQVDTSVNSQFGKNIPNQELWITEMGALSETLPNPNDTLSPTPMAQRALLKEKIRCFTNIYESSPVVTRYAWFYLGCNPAMHSYTGCGPPEYKQWGRNNLYYPNGTGLVFSDLGPVYASVPAVISPTSTPNPTLSPTPTNIAVSGTPTPTRVLSSTPTPTRSLSGTPSPTTTLAATNTPTPTPTSILPAACQTPLFTPENSCYGGDGACGRCQTNCGSNACIRVYHPAGSPADPNALNYCSNYGPISTEYTAYKCTTNLPVSICSCELLPISPTPSPSVTPIASVTPGGGATLTPTAAVTIPPGACPLKSQGDADCNNLIDIDDFNIWRTEFLAETHIQADFDGNGTVDINDFNAWRDGFLSGR